jgi:hypothetical protein
VRAQTLQAHTLLIGTSGRAHTPNYCRRMPFYFRIDERSRTSCKYIDRCQSVWCPPASHATAALPRWLVNSCAMRHIQLSNDCRSIVCQRSSCSDNRDNKQALFFCYPLCVRLHTFTMADEKKIKAAVKEGGKKGMGTIDAMLCFAGLRCASRRS